MIEGLTLPEAVLKKFPGTKISEVTHWKKQPSWGYVGESTRTSSECPDSVLHKFQKIEGMVPPKGMEVAFICVDCVRLVEPDLVPAKLFETSAYGVLKKDHQLAISGQGQAQLRLPGWESEGDLDGESCRCGGSLISLVLRQIKSEADEPVGFIRERAYVCAQCDKIFRSSDLEWVYVEDGFDRSSDGLIRDYGTYYRKANWVQKWPPPGVEPEYDLSKKIIDVKNTEEMACQKFADLIDSNVQGKISIARVPPSDSADMKKINGRLSRVARILVEKNGSRVDASACLRRSFPVATKHLGGDRSIERDLGSIEVVDINKIYRRNVLLLDDVTKTGNSMKANRELLLRSGAKRVKMLVLGKTVSAT